MTHNPHMMPKRYDWEQCWIERYPSNNGVVLMWAPNGRGDHRTEILMFIAGADIGTDQTDSTERVEKRVKPIFQAILHAHNRGFEMGHEKGTNAARTAIQKALGIIT